MDSRRNTMSKENSPANGQLKIGPYILKETIGVGTFGKVKLGVEENSGYKVAVKILNRMKMKQMDTVGKTKKEIQHLEKLQHPHITRLFNVICTPSDIFIVMELVSGGELFTLITKRGSLTVKDARRFFQQIISGVDYCHKHMIVHRDLKPENLLLDRSKNIKIADFGLSNLMTDGNFLQTCCGSPNYAAPELISTQLYAGPEVDIWSCGVILYAMLTGTLPFDDQHVPTLFNKIKTGSYTIPASMDKQASDLIMRMLQVDSLERATIKNICDHEWFKKDLAYYLFPESDNESSIVDIDAVKSVVEKYGVSEEAVTQALLKENQQEHLAIAYRLVVNHKRNCDAVTKQAIDDFYQMRNHSAGKHILHKNSKGAAQMTFEILQKDQKKMTWYLGIRSKSKPDETMLHVYNALKKHDLEWKTLNVYHIIVREKPTPENPDPTRVALQLFQMQGQLQYLLDFKSMHEEEETISLSSLYRTRQPSMSVSNKGKPEMATSPPHHNNNNEKREASLTGPTTPSIAIPAINVEGVDGSFTTGMSMSSSSKSVTFSEKEPNSKNASPDQISNASAETFPKSQTMQFFGLCHLIMRALLT